MESNITELKKRDGDQTIASVRFQNIASRETTDVSIEYAADFYVRNYATHRAIAYRWSSSPAFTTYASIRWLTGQDSRVKAIYFHDVSDTRWASTALAKPRFLGESV